MRGRGGLLESRGTASFGHGIGGRGLGGDRQAGEDLARGLAGRGQGRGGMGRGDVPGPLGVVHKVMKKSVLYLLIVDIESNEHVGTMSPADV